MQKHLEKVNAHIKKLNKEAQNYAEKLTQVKNEVLKVIVGQQAVLDKVIVALISDGHVLLEGVPGLAKTLMIKTLSDTLVSSFCRIQFTPDLLPADIIGTKIYRHKTSEFATEKGPIFHNFILADEINRAPPKVQSALLEAMQERQVTIQGDTYPLQKPFLVMATQNPIEIQGTYRLPEAQLDRFMFKILINYPNREEEKLIVKRMAGVQIPTVEKVLGQEKVLKIQHFLRTIYVDETIESYVTELVDATRHPTQYGLEMNGLIEYGASPRASIYLILGGKATALMNGRGYVIPEDIQEVAHEVLRHRIITTYEAEVENITSDNIIKRILEQVKVP